MQTGYIHQQTHSENLKLILRVILLGNSMALKRTEGRQHDVEDNWILFPTLLVKGQTVFFKAVHSKQGPHPRTRCWGGLVLPLNQWGQIHVCGLRAGNWAEAQGLRWLFLFIQPPKYSLPGNHKSPGSGQWGGIKVSVSYQVLAVQRICNLQGAFMWSNEGRPSCPVADVRSCLVNPNPLCSPSRASVSPLRLSLSLYSLFSRL